MVVADDMIVVIIIDKIECKNFVCVYLQVPISVALETIATPMQPASTWQQGLPVNVCQVTVVMAFIAKVIQQQSCEN